MALLAPAVLTVALVPGTLEKLLLHSQSRTQSPHVNLPLLDSGDLSIVSLRGRVVVLNFWGVWCGPCVRELPELEAVERMYRGDPIVAFVAVNSAIGGETPEDVRRFVAEHGLMLPVCYEADQTAYRAFDVRGLPTTLVIDGEGVVRFRRVGHLATARFREWLAGVIADLEREGRG